MTVGRSEFIDYLKGVLIVIVCIGHAIQFGMYKNADFWEDPVFKGIYMFHMPLFMALAGFLSYFGISTAGSLLQYVKKRTVSYLLPIAAWAVISQCILYMFVDGKRSVWTVSVGIVWNAVGSLWFLWALIGSIILMALVQASLRYRVWIVIVLFAGSLFLPDLGSVYLFQYTFPFFVAGFYVAAWNLPLDRLKTHMVGVTVALGIATAICFYYWHKDTYVYVSRMSLHIGNMENIWFRWLAGLIASGFWVMVLTYMYSLLGYRVKKILAKAGSDSLSIYILHGYALLFVAEVFRRYYDQTISLYYGYPIAIATGFLVAYVCWLGGYLISGNRRFAYFLLGKKVSPITA
jgi:fucose 4-O-acetylase-like acetyltransferase